MRLHERLKCPVVRVGSDLGVGTYEIRAGARPVSLKDAPSAQQALLDYVKSLGCRDAEIIRLGSASVAWRGARYTAVPATRSIGE